MVKDDRPLWKKNGFASPEAYAAEIKRKAKEGIKLTNQADAKEFVSQNPAMFGKKPGKKAGKKPDAPSAVPLTKKSGQTPDRPPVKIPKLPTAREFMTTTPKMAADRKSYSKLRAADKAKRAREKKAK